MNRTLILAFFTFLSLGVATAVAAEPAQKQDTGKPETAQPATTKPETAQPATTKPATAQPTTTKPETAKPAATKPETAKTAAAKPAEEISVLLNAPLFSPLFQDVPIASVDDEIIPLREFNEALTSLHESNEEEETKKAAKIDYKIILDRLINVSLLNMEANDMELDKLPEVQVIIEKNENDTLRQMLKDQVTKNLAPDKEVVEKYYKAATKEFKIKSVIFAKDEDAKKMAADLKGGKDFDSLAKKAVADKTAKGGEEGQYMKVDQLLPGVAAEAEKLKAGEVAPIIMVKEGYTILKLEGIRYGEDLNAKKEAEKQALMDKKRAFLKDYFADLKKKYTVMNQKLYKSLNFEKSEAAFSKLLKDKRPLIKIKDEKPITVGEYTEKINSKFYHGIGRAIQERKVNERKVDVLNEMLYNRLFLKEAKALGIDKTAEYKDSVASYKRSVVFGVFIQKAVVPDIKLTEGESKKYYEEHISDYTTPEMLKLYSLGFYKMKDAEDTLKKLQRGDDFKWLQSNASGLLKENEPGALSLNGDVFTVSGLDEGLKKALTGVKTGDYRLYSDGKFSYVINVQEDLPPQKQDYATAREDTARKVYNEKISQSIKDWAEKLRKAHEVRVYITGTGTVKAAQ
jgi:hypothetical protein